MKIIFFCPPVSVINGGIKHTFRMAECLIELGYDACVFEQNEQRPPWFFSSAPIVGQGIFHSNANHIYVLPEDQPKILADFKNFPQRKIIYSQNHFYGALGIGSASSFADYGISHILCSSQTIYNHSRLRHSSLNAYVIPCAVDDVLFRPGPVKKNAIAYMPRKRAIEAAYVKDMFHFTYPMLRDWQWTEVSNKSEAEVAHVLGTSKVFLSLSRLEGFGLTPLEAMASGCIVAGFTGIGGQEYATPKNGFWASEDDFPTCIAQLQKAVQLSLSSNQEQASYQESCFQTLTAYSPTLFKQAVRTAWHDILGAQ